MRKITAFEWISLDIMNEGRRLFADNMPESALELTAAKQLDLGVVMLDYWVNMK